MKPGIGREAMSKHLHGLPGVVEDSTRAKINDGNLGGPSGRVKNRARMGINNRERVQRESVRSIVAGKRVTIVERRGLSEERWSQREGEPLGGNAHYGMAERERAAG
jgi:hypothetical protein